jgi:ribosome biogenesis protein SSF1/2
MFEPNVAAKLKERESNTLKDFMHVAGPFGVSHFLVFSATDIGSYLRIAKFPRGPTLTFKVKGKICMRERERKRKRERKNFLLRFIYSFYFLFIVAFTTMHDIAAVQIRPHRSTVEFQRPPLIVLNNFPSDQSNTALMALTFQNMFPPLNIHTVRRKKERGRKETVIYLCVLLIKGSIE